MRGCVKHAVPGIALMTTMAGALLPAPLTAQAAAGQPPRWAFDLSAYQYVVPGAPDVALFIARADRDALHLEGRWNYESLDAGSLFAGWTIAFGDQLHVALTPMMGAVAGSVLGIAPGLEAEVTLGPAWLYVEAEYVADLRDQDASFLYTWNELGIQPVGPLQVGLLAQRLRPVNTPLTVERGAFVRVALGPVTLGAHVLNPGTDSYFTIWSVGATF